MIGAILLMKRVVITGVNGLIGSQLRKRFIDKGYHVIGIDRIDPKEKEEDSGQFEYVKLDITDQNKVKQFFSDLRFDYLIHCAALVHRNSPDLSFDNFMKINYEGTKNIFDALIEDKEKDEFIKAVFLSTIEVYGGECEEKILSEEDECNPITFYGKSKWAAEEYLLELIETYNLNVTILRLAPVYGESFLRNVKVRVMSPGNMFFYKVGTGGQKISLCSLNNVIDIIENCIRAKSSFADVFNIADDAVYSFMELSDYFRKISGEHITIKIPEKLIVVLIKILTFLFKEKKERLRSIYCKLTKDNIYSIEKSQKYLQYNPKWNFKNTIFKDIKDD